MALEIFFVLWCSSVDKSYSICTIKSIHLCQKDMRCMKSSASHWLWWHGRTLERHRHMCPACSLSSQATETSHVSWAWACFPGIHVYVIYAWLRWMVLCAMVIEVSGKVPPSAESDTGPVMAKNTPWALRSGLSSKKWLSRVSSPLCDNSCCL